MKDCTFLELSYRKFSEWGTLLHLIKLPLGLLKKSNLL